MREIMHGVERSCWQFIAKINTYLVLHCSQSLQLSNNYCIEYIPRGLARMFPGYDDDDHHHHPMLLRGTIYYLQLLFVPCDSASTFI